MTHEQPPVVSPVASPSPAARKIPVIATAILIAGAAVLYGIFGLGGKQTANECAPSAAVAKRLAPFAQGEVAALTMSSNPKTAVPVEFDGPGGTRRSMADYTGKALLLNLWATWCIPCREEMPSLDRLQARLGDDSFEVVAVSVDTARLEKRQPFLDEAGVKHLAFYSDASADIFQRLKRAGKVLGLPTTLVIDRSGCELGVMAGPADWSSDDAVRLITALKAP